jgi:hypothetical protein
MAPPHSVAIRVAISPDLNVPGAIPFDPCSEKSQGCELDSSSMPDPSRGAKLIHPGAQYSLTPIRRGNNPGKFSGRTRA